MRAFAILAVATLAACSLTALEGGEGDGEGEGEGEGAVELVAACDQSEPTYTFSQELESLDFGGTSADGDIRIVVDESRASALLESTDAITIGESNSRSTFEAGSSSVRITTPASIVELGLVVGDGDVCVREVSGTVAIDSSGGLVELSIPAGTEPWGVRSAGDTIVHVDPTLNLLGEADSVRVDPALGCTTIGDSTVTCGAVDHADVVVSVDDAALQIEAH